MTTWDTVIDAVTLALGGERAAGRAALDAAWAGTGEGDHAARCVLAHYLADVQDTLDDEVRWDETALREHASVGEADLAALGIPSAAGLAPSLHLNLGDGYARRGELAAAREQLHAGRAASGSLGDDGYGAMIRQGLEGLRERIDEAERAAAADHAP